ncbi:MAG TPA: hypothetical protein VHF45_06115 [Thermoleophilaceae bacterium]|nr:hypothetical protein [Thermoleophilaceae bacterium]
MNRRTRSTRWALALALTVVAVAAPVAWAQIGDDILTSPDCMVSDGGRLTVANGDEATFGGNASTRRSGFGHQILVNHGPAAEFTFTTVEITSLTCIEDGGYATMTGTGRVESGEGPDQIVEFRLEMQDTHDGPRADGYHLTLSNGYDTGLQLVQHGEIQVRFP